MLPLDRRGDIIETDILLCRVKQRKIERGELFMHVYLLMPYAYWMQASKRISTGRKHSLALKER